MTHSCIPRWRRLLNLLLPRSRRTACSCLLIATTPVQVHGQGSEQDPYVIKL